ncbi:MAG TPA: Rieske 2Fe-2S domain-containing protein [Vicinamibacterales bacterium]|jgi:nitrite reductase/ring-hydroxylating ferredoxin subunit
MATESSLTDVPQSWYLMCRSRELGRGRIVSREILGHQLAIFRAQSGAVTAMDARCAHMGAHLGRGDVVGDRIRCALHHWTCDAAGVCRSPNGTTWRPQTIYPTIERHGAIFMFAGPEPRFDLPSLAQPDESPLRVMAGATRAIETTWGSIVTNAFDIGHMQAVHARALREDPALMLLGSDGLQMRYVSRVTGAGLSDRVMRWLSDDAIRATISCWGGTVVIVRSQVGMLDTRLMLCVTPTTTGVDVTPFFGVLRTSAGAIDAAAIRVTRWLFTAFLSRDLVPLHGMRLRIDGALATPGPLSWATRWLLTLPAASFTSADDSPTASVQRGVVSGSSRTQL